MKRIILLILSWGQMVSGGFSAHPQFTASETAAQEKWADFLKGATIVSSSQMGGADAVTNPWKLTLGEGEVTCCGLWKNPKQKSFDEWRYEIAAFRINRLIGLNMVPPTVERRFQSRKGSLQLWLDGAASLKKMTQEGKSIPLDRQQNWNRASYLQRVFDNLIANPDRNANNILIDSEWRIFLCDHSRSFRSSRQFTQSLLFGAEGTMRSPDGQPFLFRQLPRRLVEKIEALDFDTIKQAVGSYLTKKEINAILARKQLILEEIDAMIREHGEHNVLYEQ